MKTVILNIEEFSLPLKELQFTINYAMAHTIFKIAKRLFPFNLHYHQHCHDILFVF